MPYRPPPGADITGWDNWRGNGWLNVARCLYGNKGNAEAGISCHACLPKSPLRIAGQPFSLHARLYSPRTAAIDGTWAIPPVEQVK
jgi:hypothetical protein